MCTTTTEWSTAFALTKTWNSRLTAAMHKRGIDLRYFRLLLESIQPIPTNAIAIQLIKVEMVARTCKWLLAGELRKVQSPKTDYEVATDRFLKVVTGQGPKTDEYWTTTLLLHLQYKFGHHMTVKRSDPSRKAPFSAAVALPCRSHDKQKVGRSSRWIYGSPKQKSTPESSESVRELYPQTILCYSVEQFGSAEFSSRGN
eukprot:TRINITY_DN21300_c0_g1_i1.p1 TRINITY_DN21300_c0_g1~~TRINITY_DN21300_c0_g1_i1.p1  ORF type:complete len:200 (+),score=8.86 TRINITY_DN21300_c0_g1_i1:197-796(+)